VDSVEILEDLVEPNVNRAQYTIFLFENFLTKPD